MVDISTNSAIYDITTSEEVDWLKIHKFSEEIKLVAECNNTDQTRMVKLYAKSGDQMREIVVSQAGIQRYLLPINPECHRMFIRLWTMNWDAEAIFANISKLCRFGIEETYTFILLPPYLR